MPQPFVEVGDLPTALAPTPELPFGPAADPVGELDRQVAVYEALGAATLLGLPPGGLPDAVAHLRARLAAGPGSGGAGEDVRPGAPAAARGGAASDEVTGVGREEDTAGRDEDAAGHDGLGVGQGRAERAGRGDVSDVGRQEGAAGRADDVPFVLVLPVDPNDLVPAMRRGDRRGVSVLPPEELAGYRPTVEVPEGPYLLVGVDVGSEFRSVAPGAAAPVIRGRGRTGLTVAEGVALAVVRPDRLRPNRCWSLLASRAENKRVPAVWISERRAKLGWCWEGNPHTWLGAASAAGRIGLRSPAGLRPGGR